MNIRTQSSSSSREPILYTSCSASCSSWSLSSSDNVMDGCKIGASACMLPMISVPTTASAERIRTFSSRVVLRFSLGVPMSGSGAEMIPIPVDDDDDAADDDDDDDDEDTPLLGCGPLSALTAVLSSSL